MNDEARLALEQIHRTQFGFSPWNDFARVWCEVARIVARGPATLSGTESLSDLCAPPGDLDSAQMNALVEFMVDEVPNGVPPSACTLAEFVEYILRYSSRSTKS